MSRPHITLTDAQRAEVETLAAVLNAEQIADFLGFGRTTFEFVTVYTDDNGNRVKAPLDLGGEAKSELPRDGSPPRSGRRLTG